MIENLFRKFGRRLDDFVSLRSILLPLNAIWAVLTFLSASGFIAGYAALGTLFAYLAIAFLAMALIALLSVRASLRDEVREARQLLHQYAQRAMKEQQDRAALDEWDESIVIGKVGDARFVRKLVIRNTGPQDLLSATILFDRNSEADLNDNLRRSLRPRVRNLKDNGELGVRLVATVHWESPVTMYVHVHFDEPCSPGHLVRVQVTLDWPRYMSDLNRSGVEKLYWRFSQGLPSLRTQLCLEREFLRSRKVITQPIDGGSMHANIDCMPTGDVVVSYVHRAIDPSTVVGYKLELAE